MRPLISAESRSLPRSAAADLGGTFGEAKERYLQGPDPRLLQQRGGHFFPYLQEIYPTDRTEPGGVNATNTWGPAEFLTFETARQNRALRVSPNPPIYTRGMAY